MAQTFSFPNYGLFNSTYYLQQNPDVATSWTGTPLQHYIQFGALEGRAPTAWFNADFYRASYADLQSMNALQLFNHYCNYGYNEGRVPMLNFSNFNGARYLLDNPDVAAAGYTPANAISHFVNYGEYEGRVAYADNGVVINPVVNEGELFTLTNGVDSIAGTQFNDTFDASQAGTLQSFDSLDGMGGTDTLYATLNAVSVTPSRLANMEVISATATGSAGSTLNLVNAGQLTNVINNASTNTAGALTFTNIAAAATALGVSNTTAATQFDYASTAGTQSVDLAVDGVIGTTTGAGANITIAGVETVNITSSGNLANEVDLIASSATTVTAAGTAALNIAGADTDLIAATLIDGTNMIGALTATLELAGTINGGLGNDVLTGSSGNDVIAGNAGNDVLLTGAGGNDSVSGGLGDDTINTYVSTTGYLTVNDTIDGGVGTNTLGVTAAQVEASTVFTNISNIQTLNAATAGTNNATMDVVKVASSINQVILGAGAGATYTVNMNAADSTLQLGAATGSTLLTVAETGGTGTSDSLTIANTNVVTGTSSVDVFGNVTTTGFETVNINTGLVATTAQTIGTLTINGETAASTPVTLNVSGINTLDISTALATSNAGLTTVNASGLTGAAILDINAFSGVTGSTLSITGSAGNDVLGVSSSTVLSNYATTVDAGAGADAVYTGSAADSIHGGAGNDTLNSGTGNDIVRGGDGQDLITVGAGAVSVDGGAGNDNVNVSDTLNTGDVLDGGADVDTLQMSVALVAPYANVTNFETLQLNGASLTQNMANFTGTTFTRVDLAATGSQYLTNVGSAMQNLRILDGTTLASVALATDTAADSLTIGSQTDAATTVTGVTANDIETLTIGAGANTAVRNFQVGTLTANDLVTLNVTGNVNFVSTIANQGATDVLATVNAASNTGTVSFTATNLDSNINMAGSLTAANSLVGGGGNDTITGGAANDTLTGAAGNDVITGAAGNDLIDGGDGVDVINAGTGVDTVFGGGSGDSITLASTGSLLDYAAKTDSWTGTSIVSSGSTALTGVDVINFSALNTTGNTVKLDLTDLNGETTSALTGHASVQSSISALAAAGITEVVTGSYNTLTGIFTAGAASATANADVLVLTRSADTTGAVEHYEAVVLQGTLGHNVTTIGISSNVLTLDLA